MIKEIHDKLKYTKPNLAPIEVFQAYAKLEGRQINSPIKELTAIVAII